MKNLVALVDAADGNRRRVLSQMDKQGHMFVPAYCLPRIFVDELISLVCLRVELGHHQSITGAVRPLMTDVY